MCVLATIGAGASTAIVSTSRAAFAPWSTIGAAGPQVAVGDFDGDGHSDVARIATRGGIGRRDVSIALSSAEGDELHLDGAVFALVEGDIDHDGDLDLLATTPSGGLLVWLNDGHGRFTRQASSPRHSFAGESGVGSTTTNTVATALTNASVLPSRLDGMRGVVVQASRPPNAVGSPNRVRLLLPPLRAPPLSF